MILLEPDIKAVVSGYHFFSICFLSKLNSPCIIVNGESSPFPLKPFIVCVVRLGLKESIKKLKPKHNIFRNELLMRKSINREDRVRSPPDGCNLQERVVTILRGISGKLVGEVVVVFVFVFVLILFFSLFLFFPCHPVTLSLSGIVLISTKRHPFKLA